MSSDLPTAESSSDLVIQARSLGKRYATFSRPSDRLRRLFSSGAPDNGFWAVRNVDLEIARGETVGILGRNGSGKSTLLEMIAGTLQPTEGELEVHGRLAALLELGAGLNPEFTGRENIHLSATVLGLSPDEIAERYERIIEFADIGRFVEQPLKYYSSGMYARLAFAVAINVDAEILIVDEILSVGDEGFQRKCFARIEEIKAGGGTILFVSHAASAILELCDRAVLLEGGEQLLTGQPKTVVTLYQKLAYASEENIPAVLAEIASEAASPGGLETHAGQFDDAQMGQPEADSFASDPVEEELAYFDPDLKSKTVVPYEPNGAQIENPVVLTAAGEPVNCLAVQGTYQLQYEVHFNRDVTNVRYHTLLKTVTGLELGGAASPALGSVAASVKQGERLTVRFTFRCSLNPGTYFLNCGVTGDDHVQIHRIVDALAIRVLPLAEVSTFGHMHFDHQAVVCAS